MGIGRAALSLSGTFLPGPERQRSWGEPEVLGQARGPGMSQRSWDEPGLYPSCAGQLKVQLGQAAGSVCLSRALCGFGPAWSRSQKVQTEALKHAGLLLAQGWLAAEVTRSVSSHQDDAPGPQIPGAKAATGRSHRESCCFCCLCVAIRGYQGLAVPLCSVPGL